MKSIERMSRNQRDKLRKRLEGKEHADEVIALIERSQDDKPACPDCKATELYRWGKVSDLQRYRCRQCNRTFNTLTGTPLARLRHKDKWFEYEQTLIQGLSIRKSADSCKIAKNTSFKWRHRFLQIPATRQPSKMNGIVEADETYFLESFKGQRRLPRFARKRGGKAVKKGTSKEQVPVLVVCDRHGETADRILHGTSARQANIVHHPVNIAAGQRVINNIYHIQNVNAYDSRLKQ